MKTSEEILSIISENSPITTDALASLVFGDNIYEKNFFKVLTCLEKKSEIIYTKKGKITTPEKAGFVTGQYITSHSISYIITSEGELPVKHHADTRPLPYDIVLALPDRKKGNVTLVRILTRAEKEYVGVIIPIRDEFEFVPYKSRIPFKLILKKNEIGDASPFDKICIKLIGVKKNGKIASEFITNYGNSKTSSANYGAILDMYEIDTEFPQEVLTFTDNIADTLSPEDMKDRLDLRNKKIFTIDPSDALDLDDAVSFEKTVTGFTLGVHIADVSHYVTDNSILDIEAFNRATSVYFTDKVVPMLPKKLSNGLCSLSENDDRLAISVLININENGNVLDTNIKKSIIRNVKKCSYDNINSILESTASKEILDSHADLIDIIFMMNSIAKKLTSKRFARGAIDFAENECKIILDTKGNVSSIVSYDRGDSQKMIEEFMLLANEATASFVFWQNIPFVYRVHNNPDEEKVSNIITIAKTLGYTYKGKLSKNYSLNIQKIVKFFEDTPYNNIISTLSLRSMKRAVYSNDCTGHFGLCLEKYCHFTSPIRRYPDLICHRIIKLILDGKISSKTVDLLEKSTSSIAKHSTEKEINATRAERAIEDMYKAFYMESHVGEKFEAVISSVTNFGFFAELQNTVEGLVHISDIPDDYYVFDEKTLSLRGEKHKNKYSIGDTIEVICSNVDVAMGKIKFTLPKKQK